jgi:hypothetical protein
MSEAAVAEAPAATASSTPQPFNDAFADLEGFTSPPGDEGPPKTGRSKPELAMPSVDKGEVETPHEVEPKSENKTHDKTPQDKPKLDDKTPEKPKSRIVELSKAYEGLKAKHRQLEQSLMAKDAEIEAIKSKPAEDPEKKTLQERLTEREKRLADMENKIKFSDYQSSQEYKERYEQPFVDAWQAGRAKTSSLKITDADGNSRQATKEDFDRIAMIGDDDVAADVTTEMFGTKAPMVMYHRERVQEMNTAKVKAIEDYRKQGSEREKQNTERFQQQRQKMIGLLDTIQTQAAEKFPHLFKPVEGDEKGNDLLKQGMERASLFKPDANVTGIPQEKLVALHARMLNESAAFPRLLHQKKGLETKVAELEKELAQYRSSEPGAGDGDGKPKSKVDDGSDWENQMDKLARPPS